MYVLLVKVQIKPEFREDFIRAAIDMDAKGSVETEPGVLRFDVIQDEANPNTIYYYEVYRDLAAFKAHTESSHFIRYRDATQKWLAAPTEVYRGTSLYPTEGMWEKQKG